MIQFLYPWFLWGLLTLLIPVIIHLFHFRRYKKVYFTNVKLLKEVKEQTSQRAKLRHFMILLSRMLLLAMLVLAFAQPFIADQEDVRQGARSVSIYIDNSFSMQSSGQDLPLIELAKFKALEIIDAYEPEDEFQILTNRFGVAGQRWLSMDDAREMVSAIEAEPHARTLDEVWDRQQQALNFANTEIKEVYVLSDFQKGTIDLPAIEDSLIAVRWIPLQPVRQQNVSIDSVWFESPVIVSNQINPLIIQLSNRGFENADEVRLNVKIGDQVIPVSTLSIQGNSTITDTVQLQIGAAGSFSGIVGITDYPIQFDDTYYFTFNVPPFIEVLYIADNIPINNSWRAMFAGAPYYRLTEAASDRIDFSQLSQYQLIIVDQLSILSTGLINALQQFAEAGGNVTLFPGANAEVNSYNQLLRNVGGNQLTAFRQGDFNVSYINQESFVFREVFDESNLALRLPAGNARWEISRAQTIAVDQLMRFRDGAPVLEQYEFGRGHVFLVTLPTDQNISQWKRQGELFIPMVYRMALLSKGLLKQAYIIGRDQVIEMESPIERERQIYRLVSDGGEFIPGQRAIGSVTLLEVYDQVEDAGIFQILTQSGTQVNKVAFNFDRTESIMDFFALSEIKTHADAIENLEIIESRPEQNLQFLIAERSRGVPLWRWFVVAALLFFLTESLLIRFWKS